MTQEEKSILFIDLCARVPYGAKVQYKGNRYDLTEMHKDGRTYLGSYNSIYGDWHCSLKFEDYPKPYLRPMSSMTDEEKSRYNLLQGLSHLDQHWTVDDGKVYRYADAIDWLNANHFDYRGLIEKGLAIEAPEGLYE